MIEKLTTLDFRQHLGDLLNRVALRHYEFIIERKGKPLAAMVPVEKFRQLEQFARLHMADALAPRKTALSQKDADALADEAKHRSRKLKAR